MPGSAWTGWPRLEATLKTEQEARRRAERALGDAQASLRDLQTRLGHATLERDEAREAARRAEADRQAAIAELEAGRSAAPRPAADPAAAPPPTGKRRGRPPGVKSAAAAPPAADAPVKRRGRPPGSKNGVRKLRVKEPTPVKWW